MEQHTPHPYVRLRLCLSRIFKAGNTCKKYNGGGYAAAEL